MRVSTISSRVLDFSTIDQSFNYSELFQVSDEKFLVGEVGKLFQRLFTAIKNLIFRRPFTMWSQTLLTPTI